MTKVDDHVRIRLISQLIKGVSGILQILFKYFNGTSILKSFVLPAAGVCLVNFTLHLSDALLPGKLTILPSLSKIGLSLWYCHKPFDVFE